MATNKRRLSEAERDQRRARDRQRLKDACEQLLSSEGWQRWVRPRPQRPRALLRVESLPDPARKPQRELRRRLQSVARAWLLRPQRRTRDLDLRADGRTPPRRQLRRGHRRGGAPG